MTGITAMIMAIERLMTKTVLIITNAGELIDEYK